MRVTKRSRTEERFGAFGVALEGPEDLMGSSVGVSVGFHLTHDDDLARRTILSLGLGEGGARIQRGGGHTWLEARRNDVDVAVFVSDVVAAELSIDPEKEGRLRNLLTVLETRGMRNGFLYRTAESEDDVTHFRGEVLESQGETRELGALAGYDGLGRIHVRSGPASYYYDTPREVIYDGWVLD